MSRWWMWPVMAGLALACHAEGVMFKVPTREGVHTTLFWEAGPSAKATVLLFPGGGGGFGRIEEGRATSQNFLVRAEPIFVAQGFNVAIFGRPSDVEALGYTDRISPAHMVDVRKVLAFVKDQADVPVWLVGTSRGTVSATAAAIELQNGIAGVVLTSSVVSARMSGAVPKQELAEIRVPVLVLHHVRDACHVCQPLEVPAILRGLRNAPVKKEVMVDGGENPRGDACEALHWHGFIGMEREAVELIGNWIRNPVK